MPRGVNLRDEASLQQRLWTPQLLRGNGILAAHYDASIPGSLPQASSNVTAWNDQSGFNRNFTATNSPTYADRTVSLPNAGTAFFSGATFPASTYELYLVGTPSAPGGFRSVILSAASNSQLVLNTATTQMGVYNGAFTQAGTLTWPGAQFGQAWVAIAGGSLQFMNRDGGPPASTAVAVTLAATPISILGGGAIGFGDANEIVVTPIVGFTWVRQLVEGYLAWKWTALARRKGDLVALLPFDHPYKRMPPLK